MTYYLILPQKVVDAENNIYNNRYELGEESFGTFYPSQGYHLFEDLANRTPELLEEVKIKTEEGEKLSPEEFLEQLENLTVLI